MGLEIDAAVISHRTSSIQLAVGAHAGASVGLLGDTCGRERCAKHYSSVCNNTTTS